MMLLKNSSFYALIIKGKLTRRKKRHWGGGRRGGGGGEGEFEKGGRGRKMVGVAYPTMPADTGARLESFTGFNSPTAHCHHPHRTDQRAGSARFE